MPTSSHTMTAFSNTSLGYDGTSSLGGSTAHATNNGVTLVVVDDDPSFDDEQNLGGQTYDTSSQVLGNAIGSSQPGQVVQSVYRWAVTNQTTGETGFAYILRIYTGTDPANPGNQDGQYYQVFTIAVHAGDTLLETSPTYVGQAPYADLFGADRAPVIDLNGVDAGIDNSAAYTENAAPVVLASGLVLTDSDDTNIESASVSVGAGFIANADYLTVNGGTNGTVGAITFAYSAATGVLTLTGSDTLANYQAVLAQVGFESTSDTPGTSRTIVWTVNDGDLPGTSAHTEIAVTPVDDAAAAQPDAFATDEATAISGSVFSNNGSGADGDVDGPALSVSAVNGSAANVGTQITLASGALLTLGADGTFSYDPNHAFDATPTPASGASNTPGHDSFTYTLAGGSTATVSITLTGLDTDDLLLGTAGTDILFAGAGNDTLNGLAGIDQMSGGTGDDVYIVDNASDVVIEATGNGFDLIRTSVSYALNDSSEVESLSAFDPSGTAAINLTGNSLDNYLTGNAGANQLIGGAGSDLLDGQAGIDTAVFADNGLNYTSTAIGWVISSSEGNDVLQRTEIVVDGTGQRNLLVGATAFVGIQAALDGSIAGDNIRLASGSYSGTVNYSVSGLTVIAQPGAVQNITYATAGTDGISVIADGGDDTITTGNGNDVLYGNAGVDHLNAGGGNDYVDGGVGADVMTGGAGNDMYIVDNGLDLVIEAAAGGNDIVYASSDYALGGGAEVETLAARDNSLTVARALVGNEFANTILGNNGANFIDGQGGADLMAGYGGNDVYAVDNAGDQVFEGAGGGSDTVYTTIGYTLAGGQEVETLAARDNSATTALNLIGNEFANTLLGNNGANFLDGGAGADVMAGYGGNDVYGVDNAGDQVFEGAGGGTDAVYTTASYTLAAGQSVETLAARDNSATTALNLTGNELANILAGNNGANVLNGGAGSDILVGYGGADTFAFTTALGPNNVDFVADFVHGTDKIALDDAVFTQIGGLGTLSSGAFTTGSGAGDADDRIIYNAATGQLFYDADGNGAGAGVLFAQLSSGLNLSASDFLVI